MPPNNEHIDTCPPTHLYTCNTERYLPRANSRVLSSALHKCIPVGNGDGPLPGSDGPPAPPPHPSPPILDDENIDDDGIPLLPPTGDDDDDDVDSPKDPLQHENTRYITK